MKTLQLGLVIISHHIHKNLRIQQYQCTYVHGYIGKASVCLILKTG